MSGEQSGCGRISHSNCRSFSRVIFVTCGLALSWMSWAHWEAFLINSPAVRSTVQPLLSCWAATVRTVWHRELTTKRITWSCAGVVQLWVRTQVVHGHLPTAACALCFHKAPTSHPKWRSNLTRQSCDCKTATTKPHSFVARDRALWASEAPIWEASVLRQIMDGRQSTLCPINIEQKTRSACLHARVFACILQAIIVALWHRYRSGLKRTSPIQKSAPNRQILEKNSGIKIVTTFPQ